MKSTGRVDLLRESARNPLLFQILSLYLLLLAFFVVLNSISHVEQARSRAVSGSLNETFAAEGRAADKTVLFTSSEGSAVADAAFTNRIGELIRTELAIAKIEEVQPGRLLSVGLPADSIFMPDRSAIDPLYRPLIERVAKAMAETRPGVRYDVDILLGAAGSDRLAVSRSAYLASVFVASGAPPRRVAAGVEHGAPGLLTLYFHVRPEAEGRVHFREDQVP